MTAMETKPGMQTTEFWGKVVMQLLLIGNSLFNAHATLTSEQAMAIAAGMEALYGVSRSFAKGMAGTKSNTLVTSPSVEIKQ